MIMFDIGTRVINDTNPHIFVNGRLRKVTQYTYGGQKETLLHIEWHNGNKGKYSSSRFTIKDGTLYLKF